MPTSHPNTLDFSNIALQPDPGDAFAALPVHVLITHVLSSRNLPDPSDLARLRAVSREMRDAVAATGRKVYELGAKKAIQFGDLSGLQLLHQRGDLCYDNITSSLGMCINPWAAGEGQLEILKWLRANDFPWGKQTCGVRRAPRGAAVGVRERLSVGRRHVLVCGVGRATRGVAVGVRERLSVEREDVHGCGAGRAPRGAAVGTRERLSVAQLDVLDGGEGRAPRDTAVGARERLPVGPSDVRERDGERALRVVILGSGERRTRSLRRHF